MKKSIFLLILFVGCLIKHSDAQILKRLSQRVENAAVETVESKIEQKTKEETGKAMDTVLDGEKSDTTQQKRSASNTASTGFSDKEPASSYQFKHRVEMEMTSNKETMNLNYFLPESGNFMCTMVETEEAPSGNLSVIDLDKDAMFMFLDQGGAKTRMAIDLDLKSANDEAEEETESYTVTKTGNTKTILGYSCEEYLIVGNDMTINAWITEEVDVRFPEDFTNVKQENNNQAWVNDVDGFAMEMTLVDTSKKKPQTTTIVCTAIETSNLTINSSEYAKFSI